jgi:type I restriction enzyme, S subunit
VSALPATWREAELGDVVPYGETLKVEPSAIPDDAWMLELEDIEKDWSRLLARVLYGERRSKSTKNAFRKGDVLYGKLRPYLRKVLRADRDGFCSTEIVPIRGNSTVHAGYLYHWLKHPAFVDYATRVSHGLNMPRLGTASGRQAPFVIAPYNEQERIAKKLDSIERRIGACRRRLSEIPQLLKRFREAVLQAAVSGRLTEEWRETAGRRESSIVELERHEESRLRRMNVRRGKELAGAVELGELPSTWGWVENWRLADDTSNAICAGPFGTIFKAKDFRDRGIPIIFLRHVGQGRYNTEKPGFMDTKRWEEVHQPYSVYGGELLVTKLGDPPGTACLYPKGCGVAMVTPDVMKMSVDEQVANPRYLMHFFNSRCAKQITQELAFGVTRLRIDLMMFKRFPIPLPPRKEQEEIVRRVDELFAAAASLERQYQVAVDRVEKLAPAALAKAFRGELVPQDPNDEPAEKLLERTRRQSAERHARSSQNSRRRPAAAGSRARAG